MPCHPGGWLRAACSAVLSSCCRNGCRWPPCVSCGGAAVLSPALPAAAAARPLDWLWLTLCPCTLHAQILYADSFRLAVAPKSTDPLFLAFSIFVMVRN